jgi:hypothetical protein
MEDDGAGGDEVATREEAEEETAETAVGRVCTGALSATLLRRRLLPCDDRPYTPVTRASIGTPAILARSLALLTDLGRMEPL